MKGRLHCGLHCGYSKPVDPSVFTWQTIYWQRTPLQYPSKNGQCVKKTTTSISSLIQGLLYSRVPCIVALSLQSYILNCCKCSKKPQDMRLTMLMLLQTTRVSISNLEEGPGGVLLLLQLILRLQRIVSLEEMAALECGAYSIKTPVLSLYSLNFVLYSY